MLATRTRPTGVLPALDWHAVRAHYQQRFEIHRQLIALYNQALSNRALSRPFVRLLLGISDRAANYSSSDHGLGPRVLAENADAERRIFLLAGQFGVVRHAREVPHLIRAADLQFLKIGVGSEASCLMNPAICWVANTRTIWTHLVIESGDFQHANDALRTFREGERSSEMRYDEWTHWHTLLQTSMNRIAADGRREANAAGVTPGGLRYVWADAIANELYETRHG
jgi:hypothetical protein